MRSKAGLVIAMAALGLAGCSWVPNAVNPISWYRGITGASKNDDLGKGDNDENLAEGNNQPYPNLASVPDVPSTAMSTIDKDKLVNSLIADRENAKYSPDDLRAGRSSVTAPPPPPPNAAPPADATSSTSAEPSTSSDSSSPPGSSASSAAPSGAPRAQTRGSEKPPAESSLKSPTVRSEPQGDTITPPPPPPVIPSPGGTASAAPQPPTALASATPAAVTSGAAPAHDAAQPLATFAFAAGSAQLTDQERADIATIAKAYRQKAGPIRVVGHGEAGPGTAPASDMNLALARAQAVAAVLADDGVAKKDIAVEAAPLPPSGGDVPRAEVFFAN